jgi:phosphate transport system permease protein
MTIMKSADRIIILFSWGSACILTAALSGILGYVVLKGADTLNLKLFFGDTAPMDALMLKRQVFDGLFPAIVGTLSLVVLSVILAVPLGLATGVYLAEYAGGSAKKVFNLFFDILAGVPSIVVGLFGFTVAVFLHRHVSREIGPCLLVSSLALALLVLPYIIRTTQMALEGLPADTRVTALALGATRLQNILHVLLPHSLAGIMTGVILAVGRCAEDTAVDPADRCGRCGGRPPIALGALRGAPFPHLLHIPQYANPEQLLTGYGASLILLVLCLISCTQTAPTGGDGFSNPQPAADEHLPKHGIPSQTRRGEQARHH